MGIKALVAGAGARLLRGGPGASGSGTIERILATRRPFTEEEINAGFAKARKAVEARNGKTQMITAAELPAYQAQFDVLEVFEYGDSGVCRIRYKLKDAPAEPVVPRVLSREYTGDEINAMFAKAREAVEARDGKSEMISTAELPTYQAQFDVLEVLEYGDSGVCRIRYKPKPD